MARIKNLAGNPEARARFACVACRRGNPAAAAARLLRPVSRRWSNVVPNGLPEKSVTV